jgi:cobalamin-dependent methionine synthase I
MQVAMLVIGETINGAVPKVRKAVVAHDAEAIITLARDHVDCGAQRLDADSGGLASWDERSQANLQAFSVGKLDAK